ncbi:MAG TPA: hypothetical protein VLG47_06725 [Candidatus Saccharimonadales bacterium]|nr:hypothetical protein [Candidatus Saccharimonadales bacterium]
MYQSLTLIHYVSHAFGQRYELPIPLFLFIFGGAAIVFLTFLFILPTKVKKQKKDVATDENQITDKPIKVPFAIASIILLTLLILTGIFGSQEVAENIVPTLMWLVIWIAVPLSCGVIGDWTATINPYANISKIFGSPKLRRAVLGRSEPLTWPTWLGWWPSVLLFFVIACGELIFNQTATVPAVTAWALIVYAIVCAFFALIYGSNWLTRGEIFSVLFATWGKLGYFRFGEAGIRGFAGGLVVPFEASVSRISFVLLLLISVSFDGLLSTPLWSHFEHKLPVAFIPGTKDYEMLAVAVFLLLALAIWLVFFGFAYAVRIAGKFHDSQLKTLAGLLPSLLPISFGYLLAHNIEYLIANGQLLFPLIGNPIGKESWPLHLPNPFNDSFEPNPHLLPSAFFWYLAVAVIVIVHIIAVVIAHRHLSNTSKNKSLARRAEYPWIAAMVFYTMLSLWLLAQPLVKEKSADPESKPAAVIMQQNINKDS